MLKHTVFEIWATICILAVNNYYFKGRYVTAGCDIDCCLRDILTSLSSALLTGRLSIIQVGGHAHL